jgi:uncharacterized protein DUF6491
VKHKATILSAALFLSGCASSGPAPTQERLTLYRTHSAAVESFRIGKLEGRLPRWTTLGDQALVVWNSAGEPVLLELPEKCDGLVLSKSIGLTNNAGLVTPGTNSVQLLQMNSAGGDYFCKIGGARLIDMAAVEKAGK